MAGFAWAIDALNGGCLVRRTSWNFEVFSGRDFLIRIPGSAVTVDADRPLGRAMPNLVGEELVYGSHIDLVHAGAVVSVSPWQPSQDDLFAQDWEVALS